MLDSESFERKVLSLVAEAAKGRYRQVTLARGMGLRRDLGIDSIGLLGLIVRFEEAFGLDLSDVDLGAYVGRMRTVEDALNFGRDMLGKAGLRTRGDAPPS